MTYDSVTTIVITIDKLHKTYRSGSREVVAVDSLSLEFKESTFYAIMGPSGCGKSTLLHCIGGLDQFDSGDIRIGETSLKALDDSSLTKLRRESIGFVFQFFNLLPTLTVRENVLLPLLLSGQEDKTHREFATELIEEVGLAKREDHRSHQLSGGEMQRVAVARALVHRPSVLLADEPTGNLDSATSGRIVELLKNLGTRHKTTIVMVTHSQEVANQADSLVRMKDGRLV